MIFRQLLQRATSSLSYVVARRSGGSAMIVDPLADEADCYVALLSQLDLRLELALATHSHDGATGLAELRERTGCETAMAESSEVEGISRLLSDGEWFELDRMRIQALLTPGHTSDSACFAMNDLVFTGDTLLIRSTGRTDLAGGDPAAQYESLVDKVLWLADHALIYPAHDYKGWLSSTVAEERAFNPRLKVQSAAEYVEQMDGLQIDDPTLMDLAQPPGPPYGLTRQ